ncbi:MAG: serine protease [Mesorhizobium amorphae]|nr:MAG: serine protease [Mesorhizobium amorphae]
MTVTASRRLASACLAALLAGTSLPALAQTPAAPATPPAAPAAPAQPERTQQGPESVANLAEGLLGSVVNISTSQRVGEGDGEGAGPVPPPQLPEGSPFQDFFDDFFKDRGEGRGAQRVQSLGSGFVLDAAQGIIVTNNHVIADADEIEVNFSDGAKLKAELVGTDPKTDIAVLKVDPKLKVLKAVPFGDSDRMRIGDWVMAIGNPFGLGGSVSVGIVSARNRDINSGPYDDFIQTDAAINRGNSGGPLFNMYGEVVGINTAIISPSGGSIGIGFSIPAKLASGVVEQLREFGETRRGWLGVRIQPVTDEIAESLGMKDAKGALVAGVIKGGPVDNGSIQPGDVIIRFDGQVVENMRDLPRVVAESPVGKAVDVIVVRKGEEQTVKVTLGRLEDADEASEEVGAEEGTDGPEAGEEAPAPAVSTVLGMTLGELDAAMRERFGIEEKVSGVVITEVAPDSVAAERGIAEGEVITEIAQESVTSPKQVSDRLAALKKQGRKNALLMLASKTGELRFVTVRTE